MSDTQQPTAPLALIARADPMPFQPANLDQAYKLCDYLAKADLVPDALRRKPADVMILLLAGKDLGLSITEAFRAIHVIKGKPSLASAFKIARARQHPDCEYFRLVESSAVKATWETKRRGVPEPTRFSFTVEQAKRAGLLAPSKSGEDGNWQKYPEKMLIWRAGSGLADVEYSDTLYGLPATEELELEPEPPNGGGQTIDAMPVQELPPKQTRTETLKERIKPKGVVVQRADLGQTEEQALNGELPPGDYDLGNPPIFEGEPGAAG